MARSGLAPLLWLAVHVASWLHVISGEQDAEGFHEVLGLGPDASHMDAQLAYVNLTNGHEPVGAKEEDRRRFVQVQLAFDKFSDAEVREETVGMVRYWDYVKELEDDDELRYFAEFRAGGSAQLRVIFLVGAAQLRSWGVFEAAAKLHGRAQVAQLYADVASQGPFLSSLRVKQLPAAVLFDSLSRSSRVTYSLEGVHGAVERLLQGQQHSAADLLARVVELNVENYQTRCGGGSPCNWLAIWATSSAFEARGDFGQAARPIVEACKRLHGSASRLQLRVACFWLRLDHAPAWKALLRENGLKDSDELATVVMRTEPLGFSIAPPSVDPQSTEKLHRWLEEQVANAPPSQAYLQGGLPRLPDPVGMDEDQNVKPPASFSKRAVKLLGNMAPQLGKWWQQVQVMDSEDQSILAGVVLLVLLLLGFLCSKLCSCCGRRAAGSSASEAKVLEALVPVTCVRLSRQGEKLGINIAPAAHDRFSISGIDEKGLVARWNESQPPDLRVQQGDFIVWAASASAGTTASSQAGMSALFKSADDLVLGVASLRQAGGSGPPQRIHGTVELSGLVLKDVAVLVPPRSSHAPGFDQAGLEVAQVLPRLQDWNDAQRSKGACCTQRVEVGDRIVSINGSTDVAGLAGAASPQVLLVRWGPLGSFRLERLEVSLQRSSPQDKLGLQIRQRPSAKDEIEVLDVVPDGAVARSNMAGGNRVLNGDRIVAVNGLKEQGAMMAALQSLRTSLTLERWVQEGGGHVPAATAAAALAPPAAVPPLPAAVGAAPHDHAASDPAGELSFVPGAAHMLVLAAIGVVIAIGIGILPSPVAELLGEVRRAAKAPMQPLPMPEASRSFMAQVHPELYADVAAPLLLLGLALACRFLLSELRALGRSSEAGVVSQVSVALVASFFLGYGNFFLLTWAGVYA